MVTWATDRPDGFSEADIAKLEDINPALAAIVETRAVRRISANLLDTYLGPQAGRRILAGQIQRAQGERLRAVVMMTDMRNFTGLSDRLPGDDVIELLDDYFDAIVSPIEEHKGEVLKFMGDGLLAIFPADDDEDFAPSSLRALDAATEGLDRLAALNEARRDSDRTELRTGIGLHLGEVIYGNVGAVDRLDFTVIGPAVNLASRIEGLTKRLAAPAFDLARLRRDLPPPARFAGVSPGPRPASTRRSVRPAGIARVSSARLSRLAGESRHLWRKWVPAFARTANCLIS